jgi:hypothetical protein
MADDLRERVNTPYQKRHVDGFTSFDQIGSDVAEMGSDAANSTKTLLRSIGSSLRGLPENLQRFSDKTNAATERLRRRLNK